MMNPDEHPNWEAAEAFADFGLGLFRSAVRAGCVAMIGIVAVTVVVAVLALAF